MAAQTQMEISRFTSNRSYSIPVGILAIGWILTFIGVCIAQSRFDELSGVQGHSPFSLFWFFIFFWLMTVVVFVGSIVLDEIVRAKSLIQHLMSISFVFVVLSLETSTAIVERFRGIADKYTTGSGFTITGLLFMAFSLLFLIFSLNTDLINYVVVAKPVESEKKKTKETTPSVPAAEPMTPIVISTQETPAVVKVEAV